MTGAEHLRVPGLPLVDGVTHLTHPEMRPS
jgi:hypothetical protein